MLPPKPYCSLFHSGLSATPAVVCFEVSPHGLAFNHPDPFLLSFFDVIFAIQDLDRTMSLSYPFKSYRRKTQLNWGLVWVVSRSPSHHGRDSNS